jgi:tetrahedral aminopeptidase
LDWYQSQDNNIAGDFMKSLIQKLVETTGPSGYESQIRNLIRAEITPYADEIRVDALGNLIARKGQTGKKVMLAAHMDEIGVIVTHIDEKGFARFTNLGGVMARNLPGSRVRFLNGASGVIGLEREAGNESQPTLDQMYIDLGTDRQNCPIRLADVAAFDRPFADFGNRLVSKAMDDRIGVAILIETLARIQQPAHSLYFVFSVQEEVGIRGAATAAYGLDPDIGIAVDVTDTGDTPKGIKMEVGLGKGPAIKVRDSGMLTDPRLVDWMVNTATNSHIPYQLEILERGTTDARAIQLTREGVPAGCISIPCRYIHSPSEMVDYSDIENAINLLVELLKNPIEIQ